MSKSQDRDLGMHRGISRRDFVNGMGVAVTAHLLFSLGISLAVRRLTLDQETEVRSLHPQPIRRPKETPMKYMVIIEKGRESGYLAYCPVLKGWISQGADKGEAFEVYIEALVEDGLPVPTEVGSETVEVEVSGA